MKRARFTDPAGTVRVGEWTDEGIIAAGRTYDPATVDVLAPVEASKVIGIGPNYRSMVEAVPDEGRLFWKGGTNVLAGHGDTVTLPSSGEVIYEAELGVVIGEGCRNVAASEAESVVAGYTCIDDLSNQAYTDRDSFFRTKSFDGAAPTGPVVADPGSVPADPRVRLWRNGEKCQDSADDEMLFSPGEVIAEVTQFVTLEPGDLLTTGTPAGIGRLSDGDRVEIEIEGVGRLEHDVRIL